MSAIRDKHTNKSLKNLSFFPHNSQTWKSCLHLLLWLLDSFFLVNSPLKLLLLPNIPNYLCLVPISGLLAPAPTGDSPESQGPQKQSSEAEKLNLKCPGYFIQVDEPWRQPKGCFSCSLTPRLDTISIRLLSRQKKFLKPSSTNSSRNL